MPKKEVEFKYSPEVDLTETVDVKGRAVPRYGRIKCRDTNTPLSSGVLYDMKNPLRQIKPINYEEKTNVHVSVTGKVSTDRVLVTHLPGGGMYGD